MNGRSTDYPAYNAGARPANPKDGESIKFTGKERDSETGLDYFGARYFASAQGRFTSADPKVFPSRLYDPQSWNKYHYTRNNPLLYVDPNGEDFVDYALGFANALSSDYLGGAGRGRGNSDFQNGQWIGDIAAAFVGGVEALTGTLAAGAGGAGCLVTAGGGCVAAVAAGARAVAGANAAVIAAGNLSGNGVVLSVGNSDGQSGSEGLTFEASPKHGNQSIGRSSRGPKNGQSALDNSVQVKGTSPRRVGVDRENGEFVVLDKTNGNTFHGHVRTWKDLTDQQRNALVKSGYTDRRGRILPELE